MIISHPGLVKSEIREGNKLAEYFNINYPEYSTYSSGTLAFCECPHFLIYLHKTKDDECQKIYITIRAADKMIKELDNKMKRLPELKEEYLKAMRETLSNE